MAKIENCFKCFLLADDLGQGIDAGLGNETEQLVAVLLRLNPITVMAKSPICPFPLAWDYAIRTPQ